MRVNGSQLAKMKKSIFLTHLYHKIYREEGVGIESSDYTFKDYDFCEHVKFRAIS